MAAAMAAWTESQHKWATGVDRERTGAMIKQQIWISKPTIE